MIRNGNASVLAAQQPQHNLTVIACVGVSVTIVFVLGAIGTITPMLLGGGNGDVSAVGPQTTQGTVSLIMNNVHYSNGERVSLLPGYYNFECHVTNDNPVNDVRFHYGNLDDIQNSANTVQEGDNFVHTIFTTLRFDDDVEVSPVLTCSSGANYISVFVDVQVEVAEMSSAATHLQLIIDGSVALNDGNLQLEQGRHDLKCVALSSRPDVVITWDLVGVKVNQPMQDIIRTMNGDSTYLYESYYSALITGAGNEINYVGCTARATGADIVTTMTLINLQDVQLLMEIDFVPFSNGQEVILEERDHTLTCVPVLARSSDIEVIWKLDGSLFSQRHSFTRSFTARDCGRTFRCEVRDDDISPSIQVDILVKTQPSSAIITTVPELSDSPTPVIITATHIHVVNGSRITVQCMVNGGDGEPSVSWFLHSSNGNNVQQDHVGLENSIDCVAQPVTHRFTFVALFLEHHGNEIQCSAAGDEVEIQLLIDVTVPPESAFLTLKVDGIPYRNGDTLPVTGPLPHEFQCTASNARPTPSISWLFGGQRVRENSGLSTLDSYGLMSYTSNIYSRYLTETTSVTCTADNGVPPASSGPASVRIDIVVLCDDVSAPDNGEVSSSNSDFTMDTTLTFSCNENYALSGTTTITCQSDGTWSDVTPTCDLVLVCNDIAAPGGGSVTPSSPVLSVGTTLTFTCTDKLVGSATLTCQSDLTWDNAPPICATRER